MYLHIPVHFITIYLEPNNKRDTDRTMKQLLHIVSSVQARLPSSKFVIMGDFNERTLECTSALAGKGLKALILEGTSTHNKGGHLDQVFSNLQLIRWEKQKHQFTDHDTFRVWV